MWGTRQSRPSRVGARLFVVVLVLVAGCVALNAGAGASQNPSGCSANDFVLQLKPSPAPPYTNGQTVTYNVYAGNDDVSPTGCDTSDVDVTLSTPDLVLHTLVSGASYPFETPVAFVGSASYKVDYSNAIAGDCGNVALCPVFAANATATGMLADNPSHDDPFTVSKDTSGTSITTSQLTQIKHIVVMIQENHSADNYFGQLYRQGQPAYEPEPSAPVPDPFGGPAIAPFHKTYLCESGDTNHSWNGAHVEWDGGAMNGFTFANSTSYPAGDPDPTAQDLQDPNGARAMGYWDGSDLPWYYSLYSTFATGDHFFSSVLAGTQPNRFFQWSGSSHGYIKNPSPPIPGSVMYQSIFGALSEAGISWKYYWGDTIAGLPGTGAILFPDVLTSILNVQPVSQYFTDLKNNTLPQVSFIDPTFTDGATALLNNKPNVATDEHPPSNVQVGQKYSSIVIDALGASSSWSSSALFLTYDEWGGYYDHVPPPAAVLPDATTPATAANNLPGAFNRYGVRVPVVVVSPFAKKHYVAHAVHDQTSILKFIEDRFALKRLTARDAAATPMYDFFNFGSPPFKKYPTALFKLPKVRPCARLQKPIYGNTLSGTKTLSAAAWAGDPSKPIAVKMVKFRLEGNGINKVIATVTSGGLLNNWDASWDTRKVPNGTYTLRAVAYDKAGQNGNSESITIKVMN